MMTVGGEFTFTISDLRLTFSVTFFWFRSLL